MGRRIRAFGALALLLLALAGCGMNEFNAAAYVQGLLDSTYKGTWEDTWLTLVDLTEEEAQEAYQEGLKAEYKRLAQRFWLDSGAVSRQTRAAFLEYLGQVYATARYSVGQATHSQSGAWLVEVTVQPILTLASVEKELDELRRAFNADESIPPEDREEAWAQAVLALCQSTAAVHGERVTIAVRLAPDEEDFYSIGVQDFYNLDGLILSYENG